MELHSYAKRRVVKKWGIDQKRKLVEARIQFDALFANTPNNSVLPWKKVLSLAKLDDYNVFFVRKQWSNMVAKYKQYKQNRLGNIPSKAIDDDMICKITHEWEFFQPIHHFMTRKTTNLHSYALTLGNQPSEASSHNNCVQQQEHAQQQPQQQSANNSNSSTELMNVFSSDTNDDYGAMMAEDVGERADISGRKQHHTDHRYSKSFIKQFNYFADASEDTQESMVMEAPTANDVRRTQETEQVNEGGTAVEVEIDSKLFSTIDLQKQQQRQHYHSMPEKAPTTGQQPEQMLWDSMQMQPLQYTQIKTEPMEASAGTSMQQQHTNYQQEAAATGHRRMATKPKLSERDKYYRHKRRYNRRLERRFDALLNVFGQIVKAEYPSVDVNPITRLTASSTETMLSDLLSQNQGAAGKDDSSSSSSSSSSGTEDTNVADLRDTHPIAINHSSVQQPQRELQTD